MKATLTCLLILLSCLYRPLCVSAQFIKGDIFLQGNFLELAVASNGSLGSGDKSPAGYHSLFLGLTPAKLGIVADPDKDGWTTGNPPFFGDYFLPGTPLEEWDIQVNGFTGRASRTDGDSAFSFGLGGRNVSYQSIGDLRIAEWEGAMGDLKIYQTVVIDVTKMYVLFRVKLKNAGPVRLNKIYYNRSIDPDNEVEQSMHGHPTHMKIRNQLPDPKQQVLVTAIGDEFGTYFGMCTRDCKAKTYFLNSGLIVTPGIDSLYQAIGSAAGYYYKKTDSIYADVGMGIVFNVGNLNAGDSTYISYGYLLHPGDLNALMDAFAPAWVYKGKIYRNNETIYACEGETIELGILSNGYGADWKWTYSPLLSDTVGQANKVQVHGSKSYFAVRYYPASCGGGYDTLRLNVVAAVPGNPSITRVGNVLSVPDVFAAYDWRKDGVSTGSASHSSFTVTTNGAYSVRVSNAYGCTAVSDTLVVSDLGTGVPAALAEAAIRVYPIPATDQLHIEAPQSVTAIFSDGAGRQVLKVEDARVVSLSQLPPAIYLLQLLDRNGEVLLTRKVEKAQ